MPRGERGARTRPPSMFSLIGLVFRPASSLLAGTRFARSPLSKWPRLFETERWPPRRRAPFLPAPAGEAPTERDDRARYLEPSRSPRHSARARLFRAVDCRRALHRGTAHRPRSGSAAAAVVRVASGRDASWASSKPPEPTPAPRHSHRRGRRTRHIASRSQRLSSSSAAVSAAADAGSAATSSSRDRKSSSSVPDVFGRRFLLERSPASAAGPRPPDAERASGTAAPPRPPRAVPAADAAPSTPETSATHLRLLAGARAVDRPRRRRRHRPASASARVARRPAASPAAAARTYGDRRPRPASAPPDASPLRSASLDSASLDSIFGLRILGLRILGLRVLGLRVRGRFVRGLRSGCRARPRPLDKMLACGCRMTAGASPSGCTRPARRAQSGSA